LQQQAEVPRLLASPLREAHGHCDVAVQPADRGVLALAVTGED
jgi:hypothetical protein